MGQFMNDRTRPLFLLFFLFFFSLSMLLVEYQHLTTALPPVAGRVQTVIYSGRVGHLCFFMNTEY